MSRLNSLMRWCKFVQPNPETAAARLPTQHHNGTCAATCRQQLYQLLASKALEGFIYFFALAVEFSSVVSHCSTEGRRRDPTQDVDDVVFFADDEEDFTSILRDRTHIDETLRLATEEKAKDYAGEGDAPSHSLSVVLSKNVLTSPSPSRSSSGSGEVAQDLPHLHQADGAGLQVQRAEAARDLRYRRCRCLHFVFWPAWVECWFVRRQTLFVNLQLTYFVFGLFEFFFGLLFHLKSGTSDLLKLVP